MLGRFFHKSLRSRPTLLALHRVPFLYLVASILSQHKLLGLLLRILSKPKWREEP